MFSLKQLSYSYPGKQLFKNVEQIFDTSTVIIGKNGSGKSTLLKLLAGILQPQHGSIYSDVKVAWQPAVSHLKSSLSVQEFLYVYFDLSESTEYKNAVDMLHQTYGFKDLQKNMFECSSGEIQMVLFSCSVHKASDCILLDEPFNFMDTKFKLATLDIIQNIDKPIIMTTHETWLAWKLFGHCTFLEDGAFTKCESEEEYQKMIHSFSGVPHKGFEGLFLPEMGSKA